MHFIKVPNLGSYVLPVNAKKNVILGSKSRSLPGIFMTMNVEGSHGILVIGIIRVMTPPSIGIFIFGSV
jgi:hypothetical protein